MKLILVRHGETRLNKEGRIQGLNNTSLAPSGRVQALAIAKTLLRDLPFHLYTSPVTRARETAQIIAESIGVPCKLLNGLEEANAGELEGLTSQEMRERYPAFARLWDKDLGTAQMPGGESLIFVQKRAWEAISKLMEIHPSETVVAITHNFTIQTVVCKVLGLPLQASKRLRQNVGSITRVEISISQRLLVSLNETGHLLPVMADSDEYGPPR